MCGKGVWNVGNSATTGAYRVEVIVARNGHPVAKIVPWPPIRAARVPGAWAGLVGYSNDVVGSDEEIVAMFDESAEAGMS